MSTDIELDQKIKKEVRTPSKYKVVFLNDEYTPMEWVISLLISIFKHSEESAQEITLTVHNEGSGVAGVYSYEIAESKIVEAISMTREHGFPLQIKLMEE